MLDCNRHRLYYLTGRSICEELMRDSDSEARSPRQGAIVFILGVTFVVLGFVGDFIATRPTHPHWFDLIGLDDVSLHVMVFGALGILLGGGIMAWNSIGSGDPPQSPRWPVNRWKKSK
jgi:hypothetical protein